MTVLESLGLVFGASYASGLNLYATVAFLGLLQRFEILELPESWAVLEHPLVLTVAIVLYVVEFAADKIPYLDTTWDAIHTFVRAPAAALLAYGALVEMPETWRIVATLLAGGVALTSHGSKASTRAAVNASPEPVSNWFLSLFEDGVAFFLVWLAATHPILTIALVCLLLALSIYVLFKLFRYAARAFGSPRRGAPSELMEGQAQSRLDKGRSHSL